MNLELPVTYYCAVPSRSPRGRVTETWTLDLARTALIELHCWNFGFPGEPPAPEEFWVFMGSPQNHDRMLPIVGEVIAPLLDAGRRAGMPIVHVQPESVAARYPECGMRNAESGMGEGVSSPIPHSAFRIPHSPVSDDAARRASKVHGEGYMAWDGWSRLDVAPPVRPKAGDVMVVTTEGFDAWLREREITTLLYTGFATNLCILESPAAMKPMRSLSYRCVIVREATMAVEFPDTLETLAHTRAALQYIEAWVGYSTGVADLMRGYSRIGRR
jgi:nicotinamidase-related amidase